MRFKSLWLFSKKSWIRKICMILSEDPKHLLRQVNLKPSGLQKIETLDFTVQST